MVLEAWAGVPARSALAAARELMPEAPRTAQPSVGRLPAPSVHQAGLLPGAAFIVTVIAIACWASPLAASLGGRVVEHGLMLALPLTLALQWGLQSRYLNHPQGVAQLAGRRRGLLVGAAALVAVPAGGPRRRRRARRPAGGHVDGRHAARRLPAPAHLRARRARRDAGR